MEGNNHIPCAALYGLLKSIEAREEPKRVAAEGPQDREHAEFLRKVRYEIVNEARERLARWGTQSNDGVHTPSRRCKKYAAHPICRVGGRAA